MWHNIKPLMLKLSCENEKVNIGVQESIRTVPWARSAVARSLRCHGSLTSALIALPIISKKKLFGDLLLQMPHSTVCASVAVVRILSFLHSSNDFVQFGVPEHGSLEYNFAHKKVHRDTPLSLMYLCSLHMR